MESKKENKRSGFIGGSDIAAVMGLSRWKSPLKLWAEKTGKIENGETSEAAELGSELEDFVAQKFSKRTGLKVRRDGTDFKIPEYPYMVAHIDRRIVGNDEILECKTAGAWVAKDWAGEEIPLEYVLQCNWYLGVLAAHRDTNMDRCHIAVLIGGQKFIVKEIPFDKDLFDKQVAAAKDFWETYILHDTPPMASAGDTDALLALFPSAIGDLLEITDKEKCDDLNAALERRFELKREKDAVEEDLDEIESKLKQIVGDAPGIKTDRYKVTWTPQVSRRADPEAMKAAGIFDQYSKESKTRVLRVSVATQEKKGK